MASPERLQRIDRNKVLLVEGKTAWTFFIYYLEHLQIRDVQVINFGGNTDLHDRIAGIVALPDFRGRPVISCGIVRDAECNGASAFMSVCSILHQVGLTPPTESGIPVAGEPTVGVYLLPGGGRAGMLETLCLESVAADGALECFY